MGRHAVFSRQMQDVLRESHGQPTHGYAYRETGNGPAAVLVGKRHQAHLAQVYATEDGTGAIVCTGLQDPANPVRWDDAVDLGPVGAHLGSFPAGGKATAPAFPMLLPMERVEDLLEGRLTVDEQMAAGDAADALAEANRASAAPRM